MKDMLDEVIGILVWFSILSYITYRKIRKELRSFKDSIYKRERDLQDVLDEIKRENKNG